MKRNNRTTIYILATVFALLIVVVILQGTGAPIIGLRQPTPTADPNADLLNMPRVLTDFTVLDIQAVRIGSPFNDTEFVISRTSDGSWRAPDVTAGTLNIETATLIARTTVLLPYTDTITIDNDIELAEFGFVGQNPGALQVEILLVDGTTHAIFFGGLTPTFDAIYTIVDDRDEIYLVEPRAVEFLRFQLTNPPINLTTE